MSTTVSSEQAPGRTETRNDGARRRRLLRGGVILVLAIGAFIVWRVFFAAAAQPDNVLALSGRIEGDDSAVASKASGRLLAINFREGDSVKAGEVIALL